MFLSSMYQIVLHNGDLLRFSRVRPRFTSAPFSRSGRSCLRCPLRWRRDAARHIHTSRARFPLRINPDLARRDSHVRTPERKVSPRIAMVSDFAPLPTAPVSLLSPAAYSFSISEKVGKKAIRIRTYARGRTINVTGRALRNQRRR